MVRASYRKLYIVSTQKRKETSSKKIKCLNDSINNRTRTSINWFEFNPDIFITRRCLQELLFRQFEQACEESGACKILSPERSDIAKTRCIRECVSPSCYKEIYLFDQVLIPHWSPHEISISYIFISSWGVWLQLEEGEIDVRLNSFKGCFMQRNARPRK